MDGRVGLAAVRTGGVASEVAAAQAEASAPEFEAGVGHALPLLPDVVVGGREGVVARILAGGNSV